MYRKNTYKENVKKTKFKRVSGFETCNIFWVKNNKAWMTEHGDTALYFSI